MLKCRLKDGIWYWICLLNIHHVMTECIEVKLQINNVTSYTNLEYCNNWQSSKHLEWWLHVNVWERTKRLINRIIRHTTLIMLIDQRAHGRQIGDALSIRHCQIIIRKAWPTVVGAGLKKAMVLLKLANFLVKIEKIEYTHYSCFNINKQSQLVSLDVL